MLKCIELVFSRIGEVLDIIDKLIEMNCISRRHVIIRGGNRLLIPVSGECDVDEIKGLREFRIVECNPKVLNVRGYRLRELVREFFGDEVAIHVPSSFDIVNGIALIPLRDEGLKYAKVIAYCLTLIHRNVKSVYVKGAVRGFERVRELKLVYGEPIYEVIYKEHGIKFYVNVGKVYFNPRLSTEHSRISSFVRDGEVVLDMFSGVGCFGIHIASKSNSIVYSVDINPYAVYYGLKSLRLNRLKGKVIFINCDARLLDKVFKERIFDRIIMNLPHNALDCLDIAFKLVKINGTIHLYLIAHSEEEALNIFNTKANALGFSCSDIGVRWVLDHAPREYIYCIDCIGVRAMNNA